MQFTHPLDLEPYRQRLQTADPVGVSGRVTQVVGLVIESEGPAAQIGDLCIVHDRLGGESLKAEVVGFRQQHLQLMPLGDIHRIGQGSWVTNTGSCLSVPVSEALLGRVLDAMGNPLDGGPPIEATARYPLNQTPPDPLTRPRIERPLAFGIRAIDALLTVGSGQRIGIFAGSGVGKSTLLGSIARSSQADVNVVALIGERGREVREFIERDLGPEGLARSVVVVATSDQPAILRYNGALVATAIAEFFRDEGRQVMMIMDSVTRFCWAQREIGLAIGEPPTTRGYTPSVFAKLPRLLERTGTSPTGAITGLYAVLVDGDDMNEPVADAVRSILDGHIVLDRALAARNHYPAIDVLASVSRLMPEVASPEHQRAAGQLRRLMGTYKNSEDLIQVGAYQPGSSPDIDLSIQKQPAITEFLIQPPTERVPFDDTIRALRQIAEA